jgi:hypothetical protein
MHRGPVRLHFGEPIPTTGMTMDDVEPLRDRAREWVAEKLTADSC